jgi:hypothetical protein
LDYKKIEGLFTYFLLPPFRSPSLLKILFFCITTGVYPEQVNKIAFRPGRSAEVDISLTMIILIAGY